jgi:hypothetical protein
MFFCGTPYGKEYCISSLPQGSHTLYGFKANSVGLKLAAACGLRNFKYGIKQEAVIFKFCVYLHRRPVLFYTSS